MSASKKIGDGALLSPSVSAMFDDFEQDFEQVDLGLIPMAPPSLTLPFATSSVDLSGLARVWMLLGRGGSGKSTVARWLGGNLADRDLLGSTILAALDPTNRTLAQFFSGVRQPQTRDGSETAAFLRRMVQFTKTKKLHGVWDFGGGDQSMSKTIEIDPQFDRTMRAHGTAAVAAYLLTPSIDDLVLLASFEAAGFQPEATALILNLGKAPNLAAFGPLRAQSAYKAAIARGAVEIIMPDLEPASVALEIERRRLHFFQVRDEIVPAGMKAAPIDGLEAMMLRTWLKRMDMAFAPVAGWLPWN